MRFYHDYDNRRGTNYGAGMKPGCDAHTRGWHAGVEVTVTTTDDDRDAFYVRMTSGSSGGGCGSTYLGTVTDTPDGPRWEPSASAVPSRSRKLERSADEDSPGIARHALQLAIDTLETVADHAFASGRDTDFGLETALLDLRTELARLDTPRIVTRPEENSYDMGGGY
jgi:hypothetical protein